MMVAAAAAAAAAAGAARDADHRLLHHAQAVGAGPAVRPGQCDDIRHHIIII